ncbi:MAG: hypothetical protein AAGF77_04175 [Bacteroidota bacterium]
MEAQYFEAIKNRLVDASPAISSGKMMRSEAITYKGKVFAFFSTKQKLVVKLGKAFDPNTVDYELKLFQPFKRKGPLNGWFEISFAEKHHWEALAYQALNLLQLEL